MHFVDFTNRLKFTHHFQKTKQNRVFKEVPSRFWYNGYPCKMVTCYRHDSQPIEGLLPIDVDDLHPGPTSKARWLHYWARKKALRLGGKKWNMKSW